MVLSRKDLGNLVKEARKLKAEKIGGKYTQQMLANDIDKSQSYIGDIESGRTYPSFLILNMIADACDLPISYFQDESKINSDIDKFITHNIEDLNNDQIEKIREVIKNDPDAKINHIYEAVNKDAIYKTPEDIIKHMLGKSVIMSFCGYDINKLSNEEIENFTKEVLDEIKLIALKYQK
ncbi:helix-turn-helix domain-containing protein [Clostridium cochlearium]|uniref:helix-turn-helix domain-containing protein n=1 Tax=Clostridium cochlearium TaxID=1494 RepID=UPI000BBBF2D9|nr:helix-turn-helix transcriptional regulator [Clostridium cochlearium]